jgi:stearoyl-CoA desaturase (delta-9 desaturase)
MMSTDHKNREEFLCPDLLKDPWVVWQNRHYKKLVFFHQFMMPLGVGYGLGAPLGGLAFLGFLKIFLAQQSIMSVNSFGHSVGKRSYSQKTSACDSHWVAVLTMGEGYHNFHHAYPRDYRAGIKWYALDPGKWFIWIAHSVGLASDLKRTPVERFKE